MTIEAASTAGLHPETRLVHAGTLRSQFGETSEALFLTQGHVYDSAEQCEARFLNKDPGFQYGRFSNPTVSMLEQRMAAFEGAESCRATATGMAAVTAALMSQVRAGDHVVAARALFGSCRYIIEDLLPRYGVASTLVDGTDLAAWRAAVQPNTKAFFLESPANPTLEVIDIAAVAGLAKEVGAKLVVDNVFATPLFQRPLELGADLVVYSATKHIDGQGRCLGGLVLGSKELIEGEIQIFLRQTGPALSPFNAWVMLKALETLPLRIRQQAQNATAVAKWLKGRKELPHVAFIGDPEHPQAKIIAKQMSGPSTLIAFEVAGGKEAAFRFLNKLRLIRISNNLGDAKSLIVHPATTTHQRFTPEVRASMGVSDGLIRLSIGLEHADDLIADLRQALGG
ncbi:MAG TPA: O-succinylhomoserine sulfhydrylase [Bosea sp. (in: a-proteobacteria)]|jgi:O-succinylhomoserine sulfhydrylase|uniref:O-succinylhomoserine sulfhydrylase n=1 Tax=Bosea sp. (in: a-proteobacteria) TaxID=1871050 RepID=UPI002E105E39|nr:O-succinylhomoserine sulfhydrylase [Bosea sp. (in: a-proteobacteria)]